MLKLSTLRFKSRTPNCFCLLRFCCLFVFLHGNSDLFGRKNILFSNENVQIDLDRARTHLRLLKIQSTFKCLHLNFQAFKNVLLFYHSHILLLLFYKVSFNKRHKKKVTDLKRWYYLRLIHCMFRQRFSILVNTDNAECNQVN